VEEGLITWASVYEDTPLSESGGNPWPANADGLYRGRVTVSRAVAQSLNPVAVRILEQVGAERALDFARHRLGLTGLRPAEGGRLHDLTRASLALGQQSVGLTVREVTAAYTAFSDGIYRPPLSYHRVLDREGRVLLENRPADEGNRALTPENAALMTKLLSTVTETEEGTAARYMTLTGVETAGKTGTTQHNCDRWFVGYTPRLLAGVWMGYDYPAPLKGIHGNPCVGVWNDLMAVCEARYKGSPPKAAFDMPEGLVEAEYCPLSGRAHTEACADPVGGCEAARGWFVKGTEPRLPCDVHKEAPIRWVPFDPADPHRIPLLPGDVLTETTPPRPPDLPQPDKRPFFWFFGRRRRDNE
jgi:penicillin-binding protein 1A